LREFDDLWPWLRKAIKEELRHRAFGDDGDADDRGHDDRDGDDAEHRQRRLPPPNVEIVEEIIALARKRLARRYHPDLGGDLERMKLANAKCDAILKWARSAA
jgi:hypothetical protein